MRNSKMNEKDVPCLQPYIKIKIKEKKNHEYNVNLPTYEIRLDGFNNSFFTILFLCII